MIKIKNKIIGDGNKPFIIAEISGNHNQSYSKMKKIVNAASKAGVDAIKLQTYTPDTLTLDVNNKDFYIKQKGNPWKGQTLYELYKKAYTPWSWHKKIFDLAKKKKLIAFSSAFDETSVDFLEKLNVPAYKISSFENNHFPLINKILSKKKPTLISLGATKLDDLKYLLKIIKRSKNKKVILLKCSSIYPAPHKESNLINIRTLKKMTKLNIGFSDHTKGIIAPLIAISLGACVIEKHFKLSNKDKTVDSEFSLDYLEMRKLVKEANKTWELLGKKDFKLSKLEKNSTIFKRSIYISKNLKKNEKLNKFNMRIVRPGYSISPKYFEYLIGKKLKFTKKKGSRIKLSDVY